MHILVAEDDKVSRELLRRMLESEQKHVLAIVNDGQEAWDLLLDPAKTFDVCIADIQMPNLNGLELAARIRASERLAHLPVILCTAANDRATVQRAAGLSVSGYIIKPYTRMRVVEKLRQIEAEQAAASVPAPQDVLEDGAVVCQRLGIDEETHRALLHATLNDIREWIGLLRASPAPAEVAKLLVRANGLKGACLSLGAKRAAQQLMKIQASQDAATLDGLEKETGYVADSLGVSAAA